MKVFPQEKSEAGKVLRLLRMKHYIEKQLEELRHGR